MRVPRRRQSGRQLKHGRSPAVKAPLAGGKQAPGARYWRTARPALEATLTWFCSSTRALGCSSGRVSLTRRASCATAEGPQDVSWDHLARPSWKVQAVAARLPTLDVDRAGRPPRASRRGPGRRCSRARRPVDPSRIDGLLSRGEVGDTGLGEDPVGDADARVGGREHRWLMDVYLCVGEHLVGDLAAAGRVGETREALAAHAASERQRRDDLRLTMRRALAGRAAAGQQVLAGRLRRLERGRTLGASDRALELLRRGRVGEVGRAVRAHAPGEPDGVVLPLLYLGPGRCAGGAGCAGAEGGDHRRGGDGGCGHWKR
jgi:hypothetical protein